MIAVGGLVRPAGRLRANLSGPTGHALHSLWVPDGSQVGAASRMVDLVANAQAYARGSTLPYIEGTQTGIGLRTPNDAGYRRDNPRWAPGSAGGYSPITIMWVGRLRNVVDTGGNIYGLSGASGLAPQITINQGNAGQMALQVRMGSYLNFNPSHLVNQDELLVAIGTTRSATDHEIVLWSQGAGTSSATPITCTTSSTNVGTTGSNSLYEMFATADPASPGSFDTAATHELCASWLRGMTRAEMIALAQNPWQVVRPEPSRILSAGGGGAGSSIFIPRPKLITSGFWAA